MIYLKHTLYTFFCLLLFFACRKDEVVPEPITDPINVVDDPFACDSCQEKHFDGFTEFQPYQRVTITMYTSSITPTINQEFYYRIKPHSERDGEYFYRIERKAKYNYDIDPYATDYAWTTGLYRYDYKNKIAYHYLDEEDANPTVLMDFNKEVGDTVLLSRIETNYFDQKSTSYIIEEKDIFWLNDLPMPRFRGRMIGNSLISNGSTEKLELTPYYPNPTFIDYTTSYYLTHDWAPRNFEDDNNFVFKGFGVSKFEYKLYSSTYEILNQVDVIH